MQVKPTHRPFTVNFCSLHSYQEVQVLPHVKVNPPHLGREVDNMSGTMLLKNGLSLCQISVDKINLQQKEQQEWEI